MVLLAGCSSPECPDLKVLHKNGALAAQGPACNGMKQGVWQEWYDDGTLRWQGRYRNDTLVMNGAPDPASILVTVLDGAPPFKVGSRLRTRIIAGDIHPRHLMVTTTRGLVLRSEEPDAYDFLLLPENPGEMEVTIQWVPPGASAPEALGSVRYRILP